MEKRQYRFAFDIGIGSCEGAELSDPALWLSC